MACEMGLAWLLVAIVIIFPGTFIITYVVAVQMKHVDPAFPYISDTGRKPPESCIFGQMLNIAAAVVIVIMYVRYRLVRECLDPLQHRTRVTNHVSFVLGVLSSFGVSIVANFQVSNTFVVHMIGALMAFGIGNVYAWMNVVLSFMTCPQLSSRFICYVRVIVSLFASVMFIMTFVFAGVTHFVPFVHEAMHMGSPLSEWIMSLFLLMYFVTYFSEFQRVKMTKPLILPVCMSSIVTSETANSLIASPV